MNEITPQKPKFSVIIPLYNKAPYIKRALDSALAQTVQDFEIIVVGGKSSDGGEDIVKEYTDSRIRFIQEAGIGVSAARNQGISVAKADIIAFLDADDTWRPDFLSVIQILIDKFPEAGMFGTAHTVIVNDEKRIRKYNEEKGEQIFDSYYGVRSRCGVSNQIIMMSAFAIRKDIFLKIGGFDITMKTGEDINLYERAAIETKLAYSPRVCVDYTYTVSGNTRNYMLNKPVYTDDKVNHLRDLVLSKDDNTLLKDFEQYAQMRYSYFGFMNALLGYHHDSFVMLGKTKGRHYLILRSAAIILNIIPDRIRKFIIKKHYHLD